MRRPDSDFSDEIRSHIEHEADELIAQGMDPADARAAARRKFGNIGASQERFYESRRWLWTIQLAQDIRYALRTMARNPAFSAIAILTLALGIGANTAIFSLVDAVLLKSLPVESPDELFRVVKRRESRRSVGFSHPLFRDIQQSSHGVVDLFATQNPSPWKVVFPDSSIQTPSEDVEGALVTGGYFTALGVKPVLGRLITEQDDQSPGAHPVAVISHTLWRTRFGADSAIVGRAMIKGDTVYTIIGVAPREFFGVSPGTAVEVWVPIAMQQQIWPGRNRLIDYRNNWLFVMGRRRPGVHDSQAAAALNVGFSQTQRRRAAEFTNERFRQTYLSQRIAIEPGAQGLDFLRRRYSTPLRILLGAAVIVLLIACANVANLLLARAAARRREVTVRWAIGAGRSRLIRQWLTESLVLAALGGIIGFWVAILLGQTLVAMVSSWGQAVELEVGIDWRILSFTASVSALTAILFGLAPAFNASRTGARTALAAAQRGLGDGSANPPGRRALASVQIGLSLILLVAAGLFLKTVNNLASVDPGYSRENTLMVRLPLGEAGYGLPRGEFTEAERTAAEARLNSLLTRLIDGIERLPGVRSATLSECGVLFGCIVVWERITINGRFFDPEEYGQIRVENVGNNFVETLEMTLAAGRSFTPLDNASSPPVAIINQTMAQKYFGDQPAVGSLFRWDGRDDPPIEIVGVIHDANHDGPRSETSAHIYYPRQQRPSGLTTLVVKTVVPPSAVAPQLRQAIDEADPKLSITRMATIEEQFARTIGRELLISRLTLAFGLLALVITCVGVYGLMSYAVSRRTNEIGLRMALGAERSSIIHSILSDSIRTSIAGLALGLIGVFATTRLAETLLFEVSPTDPTTLGCAAALVLAVALGASAIPAARAAAVDPMQSLRYD